MAEQGSTSVSKEGGGEAPGRRVGASAKQRGAGLAQSDGRRGDAPAASKQRGRQGKGKTGYFIISEISRDVNVKQG